MHPSDHVLDLFAVPGGLEPLAGGQGGSFRAGDLVLSPGRDAVVHDLLSPVVARLAVDLDTRAGRDRQDLRIAMPIPARDGSWVVDGWGASRFEVGAQLLVDLGATLAVAAVLHAELAQRVSDWPLVRKPPRDRWSAADRIAFADVPGDAEAAGPGAAPLVRWLLAERDVDADLGASQLVDGDLAGNVLLDADGAPMVIDIAPYWRPPLWAEAVCVLDSVMWWGADPHVMVQWRGGAPRQAMIRAALFRVVSDRPEDTAVFERALAPLSPALR